MVFCLCVCMGWGMGGREVSKWCLCVCVEGGAEG